VPLRAEPVGTFVAGLADVINIRLSRAVRDVLAPARQRVLGRYVGGAQFYFGGTSLLIVVGVAMDTVRQVESQLIMRHYDGFMKDADSRAAGLARDSGFGD